MKIMTRTKRILRWLLASTLSGVALVQLVSCDFGTTITEGEDAQEASHQRQATEEAKVQATKRYNDAKRSFDTIDGSFQVSKKQYEEDTQKHKALEESLSKLLKEREENEALVAKLDSELTSNKVSYPGVWEKKREIAQELEVAKREYESEKQRVGEIVDKVVSKLESARSTFEGYPKVINRVSTETYVAHWREFFLYIFGLKLIWGLFTGYRPTFVYPNQAKMQDEIDKYRFLAKDVMKNVASLEKFNFSKDITAEVQAVGEGLEVVLNEIKQAPKNLLALRERYNNALAAYNAFRTRYLREHPDDVKLPKNQETPELTSDVSLQDAPEAVEFAASKGQLESYVAKLRSSADTISDLLSNLILKIKTTEQAPIKRDRFNELRDVFVKAEEKERDHKSGEASLKKKLEAARERSTAIKAEIDKLNTQLKSAAEVIDAQKQKYSQLERQYQEAKAEMERAKSELSQIDEESSESAS